jgi:N-acetyltransferase
MESFLQPQHLENEMVKLQPLQESDFERLFEVGCDPLIWEQHPSNDRYQKDRFLVYFQGAMESGSAFIIMDKSTGEVAGCTRFYHYNQEESTIFIGYTFYGRKFWGTKLNPQVKKLMLDYIFEYVNQVKFHVGAQNQRSRKAMERLGAEFRGFINVAYHGEPVRENVEYLIRKENWMRNN